MILVDITICKIKKLTLFCDCAVTNYKQQTPKTSDDNNSHNIWQRTGFEATSSDIIVTVFMQQSQSNLYTKLFETDKR